MRSTVETRKRRNFENETMIVKYKNLSKEVKNLSGFIDEDGEIFFDEKTDSAERYFDAGVELAEEYKSNFSKYVKDLRKELGLSQKKMSLLVGGGVNSISRYETGKVIPVVGVLNLLKMLKKHPEDANILLNEQ